VIRHNGQTAVGSKLGYLLSGSLDTPTQEKAVINMFHVAAQPAPIVDLEQWSGMWSKWELHPRMKDFLILTLLTVSNA